MERGFITRLAALLHSSFASKLVGTDESPLVLPSAHRHGVSEADILHPLRYPTTAITQKDGMVMIIGPDRTGIPIEVGVVLWHDILAVAHAMRPARSNYLRPGGKP